METILDKLQQVSKGLYMLSETDAPFEVISFGNVKEESFDGTTLLDVLKLSLDTLIEIQEISYFFRNMTTVREGAREEKVQEAKRFQELIELLINHLKNVKAYRIGQTNIEAYLLGWTSDGQFAGLKTQLVET